MGEMVKNQVPYSDALSQAGNLAGQTKEVIGDKLADQAKRSAGQLGDVADALRRTSKELDQNVVGPYIEKAAEQIDRAAEFVRTADPQEIRRNIEGFARREPLLFIGGAFALGMIGARFLKSSAKHVEHREARYEETPTLPGLGQP